MNVTATLTLSVILCYGIYVTFLFWHFFILLQCIHLTD